MLGFERVGGTVGGAYVGVMAIAELLRAPAVARYHHRCFSSPQSPRSPAAIVPVGALWGRRHPR